MAFLTNEKKRRVFAWQMYDWANSAFVTVMVTALLPVYFQKVSAPGLSHTHPRLAAAIWPITLAVSMAFVVVAALMLGPVADAAARKKRYLGAFMALGALATALLGFSPPQWWWMIIALFLVANFGFGASNIFYDSLLPSVAEPKELDRVSTGGFALGYLGGGLMLAIAVVALFFAPKQALPGSDASFPVLASRAIFIGVALWWALFTIPLFRAVPEPSTNPETVKDALKTSMGRLAETMRNLPKYKEVFKFLIAYWLYNDGLGTIIKIAAIYGAEVLSNAKVDTGFHMLMAILLAQFAGIPCTLLWERISRLTGTRDAILGCLAVYAGICVFGYFMTQVWQFYVLGLAVAFVQGGTQALSRSMYATLIPPNREAEFFGFYNISGKFAGILGPALFAAIGFLTGGSRPAILFLILFFIIGGAVLATVKKPKAS